VVLSSLLGTKTRPLSRLETPGTADSLHYHLPQERIRSAVIVLTAEGKQRSNKTTLTSVS
jgi:hypothetical protein